MNDELEIIREPLRIAWAFLGEGNSGDYDEDDPDDVELARFDVYVRDDASLTYGTCWAPVDDASYCTQVPVDTLEPVMRQLLKVLMDRVHATYLNNDGYIKKVCEELSWIDPSWAKEA